MTDDLFNYHKQALSVYKEIYSNFSRLNTDQSSNVILLKLFITALEEGNLEEFNRLEPLLSDLTLKLLRDPKKIL